jgi:hypothetical protein
LDRRGKTVKVIVGKLEVVCFKKGRRAANGDKSFWQLIFTGLKKGHYRLVVVEDSDSDQSWAQRIPFYMLGPTYSEPNIVSPADYSSVSPNFAASGTSSASLVGGVMYEDDGQGGLGTGHAGSTTMQPGANSGNWSISFTNLPTNHTHRYHLVVTNNLNQSVREDHINVQ